MSLFFQRGIKLTRFDARDFSFYSHSALFLPVSLNTEQCSLNAVYPLVSFTNLHTVTCPNCQPLVKIKTTINKRNRASIMKLVLLYNAMPSSKNPGSVRQHFQEHEMSGNDIKYSPSSDPFGRCPPIVSRKLRLTINLLYIGNIH